MRVSAKGVFLFLLISIVLMTATVTLAPQPKTFANLDSERKVQNNIIEIFKAYLKNDRTDPKPNFDLPVHPITTEQLTQETQDVIYRLGHSSLIMKLQGQLLMMDPVLGERVSPFSFAGPKRFHQPPITIAQMPDVDVVLISHDHYDHLDKDAVRALAGKTSLFLTPTKVGKRLLDWGIDARKVKELGWWESIEHNNIRYTLTPTQHFSGRGLLDRNSTLWGSWVIAGSQKRVFFSGDSGYFDGFKTIGERFGPFDLTLIETGTYNELWADIHMMPEESVQAHIDLKGKVMLPIHNATFDLSMHNWFEPLDRALTASVERGVIMVAPQIGERMVIDEPQPVTLWWKQQ